MLPNSSDIDTKQVDPRSATLPDSGGINNIEKKVESVNYIRPVQDMLPEITPPSDFVSKKIDQFGEEVNKNKTIDVEFENYLASKQRQLEPQVRRKQTEEDKNRFIQISDNIFNKQKEEINNIDSARKQALYGVADFAQSAVDSAVEFKNVARKYFGMSEINNIPDFASQLPDPKNNGERFVRSATKFMTGMIPIARGLQAATGVAGVANSVASSGIYGFLFDDNQTDGLVNDFVKDNFDIAPDILSYMNHEIDDSKFVTRLKNSANYMVDDVAFEGAFYALKVARNLSKGRSEAYKILENGDVEVKANGKKVSEPSLFETVVPESMPKVAGLTTEDIGKKSTKDTIEEKLAQARKDIKAKYEAKQAANPDRMTMGRDEALAQIEANPMSLKELLAIKENQPVNNLVVMQAEIAQNALSKVADDIMDGVTKGTQDPNIAMIKLSNISEAMDKLSFPRSNAGRALESSKFISSLDNVDKLNTQQIKRLNDVFGNDANAIVTEYKLAKTNLTGFPVMDAVTNALRKNVDLKKAWQYVSSARINWILSDPTIHMANVLSNTSTMGLRSATELTAAGITKTRSLLGNKYLMMGLDANESRATIQGYLGGMGKGFSTIKDNITTTIKEGSVKNTKSLYSRDSNTKYNEGIDKLINDSEVANNFSEATPAKQAIKILGHAVAGTPVGKMLSWEDDFFKGMHYAAEVNKQLVMKENQIARQASQISDPIEANKYTQEEMLKVNKVRENFKAGILDEEIDAAAKQSANYWTFNSELVGEDALTKALKWGGDFRAIHPALHWFVPFYRTGANIANMSMEYTPVIGGLLKMSNVGGLSGLARGGREADTFMAKQAIGSMIMTMGALAYSQMEDTFGVDFQMSSLKNNKVGLKIGDFETSLDKQTPILKIFIAARDIMDIANISGDPEGASVAAKAAAALMVEMYSPDQLVQILGTVSDLSNPQSQNISAQFQNMLKMNVVSQVTPYSGAARFINRDIRGMDKVAIGQERGDDLISEMIKRIKHTYLGDDANIPKRLGLFGQDIPYLRTFGYQVSDNAHDMLAGYSQNDPLVQELFSLTREDVMSNPDNYDSFELNNTTILKMPPRNIVLPTGENYKLTPREYHDFVKASAGEHPRFAGKNLKSTLDKYIVSETYQSLPPKFKAEAIKDIVSLYRKAAKGIIINDNVDIMIEAKDSLERLKEEYQNVKQ